MTLKRMFNYALLFFVLGIFLSVKNIATQNFALFLFALSIILLVVDLLKDIRLLRLIAFCCFLFSAGCIVGENAANIPADSIYHFVGREGVVTGIVTAGSWKEQENGYAVFLLKASSFYFGGTAQQTSGNIKIAVRNLPDGAKIKAGSVISVGGYISPLRTTANPGNIDMLSREYRKDVYGRLSTRFEKIVETGDREITPTVWSQELLSNIKERIGKVLPANERAIVFGMLFGGYDGIERTLLKDFSTVGIVHILAVSGTHVAIIVCFVFAVLRRIKAGKKTAALLTMIVIVFYALLSGFKLPVIRAVMVAVLVLTGQLFGRKADTGALLGGVFLLCLIFEPLWLWDISFQLSFLAAAGIVCLYDKLKAALSFLPEFLGAGLAVTTAAQIALLPLLANYFHQISLAAFVSNVILLPLVEVCLILSIIGLPVFYVLPPAGSFIFVNVSLFLGILSRVISYMAEFSWSVFYLPHIPYFLWFCYYVLVAAIFNYLPVDMAGKWRSLLGAAALSASLFYFNVQMRPAGFSAHFMDVGQGDACLVITENKKAILIDSGPRSIYGDYDTGERVIVPYMKYYGINELELLVLSHGHNDHAGGAAVVVEQFPVRNIWLPKEEFSDDIERLLKNSPDSNKLIMRKDMREDIDGVKIRVVHAPEFIAKKKTLETSCIVEVSAKEHKFLFTGDADSYAERKITPELEKISVLKVAHHGAKSSSDEAFVKKAEPQLAVISVGQGNRYGHPDAWTMDTLRKYGADIARTDENGAVLVKIKNGKIIWHGYRQNAEEF